MAQVEPLYEKFGGLAAVARLVFALYDRVLRSRRLAPYFAKADMSQLIDHQTQFLASVMGGPASYTDAHLKDVHARLHISDGDFDEMMQHLEETLKTSGVTEDDMNAVLSNLNDRRRYIVNGKG